MIVAGDGEETDNDDRKDKGDEGFKEEGKGEK